jgi:hypothetical protein
MYIYKCACINILLNSVADAYDTMLKADAAEGIVCFDCFEFTFVSFHSFVSIVIC